MTKYFLCFLALLDFSSLWAQTKGVTPIAGSQEPTANKKTYAVVVGISDYQDDNIPDLRYADKDAEAFANYLRSPAGGSLDKDHLKLLLNKDATAGRIAEALDGLLEQAKESDLVIIYFSGHGDVERKTVTQPGFLLAWDAPSRVYMGGGTYSLAYLQEIVTTLSTQNLAKVVVVTDACHAGKLAGSQIGGARLTAANLAKQFSNEVKILSCQPGELSLEGEQWGGGRGVFSFHLVDALYGLADRNNDGLVTLGEVDRYLEDHVTAEAAPQSQVPILLGNKTEQLAAVDPGILAGMKKAKASSMALFASTDSRGVEEDALANVDSGLIRQFLAFKKSIAEKRFFEPENDCAEKYYALLSQNQQLASLHGWMKRNYAAALQDESQQVLNRKLKTGLSEEVLSDAKAAKIYRNYPAYLDRSAELLGPGHYMYAALKARKHYFEGEIRKEFQERKQQYREALRWQPDLPHAYSSLIVCFEAAEVDSAEYFARKAFELAPSWMLPYVVLSNFYQFRAKDVDKAKQLLDEAAKIDSTSVLVWYFMARWYESQMQFKPAEELFQKVISHPQEGICFPCAHNSLGNILKSTERPKEAEWQYRKAIQLDTGFIPALYNLGTLMEQEERPEEAIQAYLAVLALDPNYVNALISLGSIYSDLERFDESEPFLLKAIGLDSTNARAHYNLGILYRLTGRYDKSEFHHLRTIALEPNSADNYNKLGFLYVQEKRYAEAEPLYLKSIAMDSSFLRAYVNLGYLYSKTNRLDEAEKSYKKAIALDKNYSLAHYNLGYVYALKGRVEDALLQFQEAIAVNPDYTMAYYNLACLHALQSRNGQAFHNLEQAIIKGYRNFDAIQKDEDLASLRDLPEWKELMKKYFPDK